MFFSYAKAILEHCADHRHGANIAVIGERLGDFIGGLVFGIRVERHRLVEGLRQAIASAQRKCQTDC